MVTAAARPTLFAYCRSGKVEQASKWKAQVLIATNGVRRICRRALPVDREQSTEATVGGSTGDLLTRRRAKSPSRSRSLAPPPLAAAPVDGRRRGAVDGLGAAANRISSRPIAAVAVPHSSRSRLSSSASNLVGKYLTKRVITYTGDRLTGRVREPTDYSQPHSSPSSHSEGAPYPPPGAPSPLFPLKLAFSRRKRSFALLVKNRAARIRAGLCSRSCPAAHDLVTKQTNWFPNDRPAPPYARLVLTVAPLRAVDERMSHHRARRHSTPSNWLHRAATC
uniref:Uncharacterized protein n=1 Tax=Plectus sambesii TaxID=2011161 RepID=A0A914VTK4_9BILA